MAENGEKRDPSSHRTPGQIKRHYAEYQGKPENIKKRSQRNQARAKLEKEGKVHKGDGKDVGHVKPVDKGGTNARTNLRVEDRSKNRGWESRKAGDPEKPSKKR